MYSGLITPGGATSFLFVRPTPDQWDAANPPELKFFFISTDATSGAGAIALLADAWIYDTHVSTQPRVERVMEYGPDDIVIKGTVVAAVTYGEALGGGSLVSGTGGVRYKLTLGPDWEGTYEVRLAGDALLPGTLGGPSTTIPGEIHGVATLRRKTPYVTGTPVAIKFAVSGKGGFTSYSYAWWFGVGPRGAWDWPRSKEAVQFAGKRMPPPFDQVSSIFQADQRDDRHGIPRYKIPAGYSGVDAFSPGGRVVRQATVTQPAIRSQEREPPPMLQTGSLVVFKGPKPP